MTEAEFFQAGPELKNTFDADALLRRILSFHTGGEFGKFAPILRDLGERAATDMLAAARVAETSPPVHVPFDPWGNRIDRIDVSDAWKKMERLAAEYGVVATGYERRQGEFSRVFQMALLYLYHPSSALFSCPLAMTDGAAKAIELYGDHFEMKVAFDHLTSRDPAKFWTSGQWMTERTGGSDVGLSQTIARAGLDGEYALSGTKWFTSATTSQMAMTLARITPAIDAKNELSLFFVRTHDDRGLLRKIKIHRLKDKLGTKALPTAELALEGTPARLVGGPGQGVKKIASLFNVTRIYNAVCSVGSMTRGLQLAEDYAKKRVAFGGTLAANPLHMETLAELATEKALATLLIFKTATLWGREEMKLANAEESTLLRLLTTLAKLSTGKSAVRVASEVLESFGGAGYVEDTGLPVLLRDSQVFPIWEGTTNVLSMDILRAFKKENAGAIFHNDVTARLKKIDPSGMDPGLSTLRHDLERVSQWVGTQPPEILAWNARKLALALAQIYTRSLAFEFALATGHPFDREVARRADRPVDFHPREKAEEAGLATLFREETP